MGKQKFSINAGGGGRKKKVEKYFPKMYTLTNETFTQHWFFDSSDARSWHRNLRAREEGKWTPYLKTHGILGIETTRSHRDDSSSPPPLNAKAILIGSTDWHSQKSGRNRSDDSDFGVSLQRTALLRRNGELNIVRRVSVGKKFHQFVHKTIK